MTDLSKRLVLATACILGLGADLLAQEPAPRFAVKRFIEAQPQASGVAFDVRGPSVLGDMDRDGLPEYMLAAGQISTFPFGPLPVSWGIFQGGTGELVGSTRFDYQISGIGRALVDRTAVVLNTDEHGPIGVYIAPLTLGAYGVFPIPTGSPVTWIKAPDIAGDSNYSLIDDMSSVGDIDGDGNDDFLMQTIGDSKSLGDYEALVLIDGKSLQPSWGRMFFNISTVPSYEAPADAHWPLAFDVNQDGWKDVIRPLIGGFSGIGTQPLICFDGRTGDTIWRFESPLLPWASAVLFSRVGDLDGDLIPDFLSLISAGGTIQDVGYLRAISGATGQQIWVAETPDYDPYFVQWRGSRISYFVSWVDETGDGIPEFIDPGVSWTTPGTSMSQIEPWVFDGKNGHFIREIDLGIDDDMKPWTNLIQQDPWRFIEVGADIDGDGWREFGLQLLADPNHATGDKHRLVVAPESLRLPDEITTGQAVDCKIHIPSAPGARFQLLASEVFKRGSGGRHIQGWNLNISFDSTTRLLKGLPEMRGTLDRHGWYSGPLTLPAGAGLEGTTLFFRGVVFEPGASSKVKTLTTLSMVEVQ